MLSHFSYFEITSYIITPGDVPYNFGADVPMINIFLNKIISYVEITLIFNKISS